MTLPQPPHIELLGAPEIRPFEDALTEARERWKADVERQTERTVFTDQQWAAIEKSASRD
jgi:hypothetical protein